MVREISSKNIIYSFSKDNKPAAWVKSGDEVIIEAIDAFGGQIKQKDDKLESIDWNQVNPATGPIFVEGAFPGDVLKVSIRKIEIDSQGVIATGEGLGVLGGRFKGMISRILPIENDEAVFNDNLRIPLNKMIGVIGVAPEGEAVGCGTPGSHGGNMDNTMITEGASIYFPVFTEGALFALGDMHAVMGDGEVSVTGVEAAGKVHLKLEVIKNVKLQNPLLENEKYFSTIASAQTLDAAAAKATEDMADILSGKISIPLSEVVMLMSLVGQAQICQVVDPLKTARFIMPKWALSMAGFKSGI